MGMYAIPAPPKLLVEVVRERYNRGWLPRLYNNRLNPTDRPKGKDLAELILHPDMRKFGVFSGVIGWYGGGDTPNILPW